MHLKDNPPRAREAPKSIPIAGRSFAFACGLAGEELHALQEEVRARGGRIDADLNPDTDVLVVGSLPGVGRLAEKGREVILRGELYRDRRGRLEFVTEEALRVALTASPGVTREKADFWSCPSRPDEVRIRVTRPRPPQDPFRRAVATVFENQLCFVSAQPRREHS
ncbi:hypothetical protein PLCT1_00073 [Planctomycetaceae bacterium]|nr:hypothetical protein PLCT1_00073 [Planctomycetaceae bacterium]